MGKYEILTLVLTLSGVLISLYIYKKGKKDSEIIREKDWQERDRLEAEKRCQDKANKVVEGYLGLHLSSKDSGISALIKSGLSELEDEHQAELVIERIQKRIAMNPLGSYDEAIRSIGILKFFQNAPLDTLKAIGVEHIVENIRNKR